MTTIFKSPPYDRVGIVSVEEVLTHIWNNMNEPKNTGRVMIQNYSLNVQSIRLRTFALTGIICSCCKMEGKFFAIEANINKKNYHLNLWSVNEKNEEILMTHDHKKARGLGGQDIHDNTETMCGPCNWEKGQLEHKLKNNPQDDITYDQLNNFKQNKFRK